MTSNEAESGWSPIDHPRDKCWCPVGPAAVQQKLSLKGRSHVAYDDVVRPGHVMPCASDVVRRLTLCDNVSAPWGLRPSRARCTETVQISVQLCLVSRWWKSLMFMVRQFIRFIFYTTPCRLHLFIFITYLISLVTIFARDNHYYASVIVQPIKFYERPIAYSK